jgi:hypothetical protein
MKWGKFAIPHGLVVIPFPEGLLSGQCAQRAKLSIQGYLKSFPWLFVDKSQKFENFHFFFINIVLLFSITTN